MNKVDLIYITPNADRKIEEIACVCYDSEPIEDFKIFKGCMESGHYSIAEHSDVTFKITCSRACSHQLVRHRTGKFTQKSQRYCLENGFDYYIPDSIKNDKLALEYYNDVIRNIQANYKWLVDMGIPQEDARYLLPNACETTIFVTMDFRNFFHFLHERMCMRAQKEIRDIAKEMARLVSKACPTVAPYCVPKCEKSQISYCPEKKSCGRHKVLKDIVKEGEII